MTRAFEKSRRLLSSVPRAFENYFEGYLIIFALFALEVAAAVALGDGNWAILVPDASSNRWVVTSIPILWWMGPTSVALVRRRTPRPTKTFFRLMRRQRYWLIKAAVLSAMIVTFSGAVMILKYSIPNYVPFYADPWLIAADRFIFGTDPWKLTHNIFGPTWTVILDRIYILWFFVMLSLTIWFIFTRDIRFQIRGLLAYALTWSLLGNFMAAALSSVGPWDYQTSFGSPEFEPLMHRLAEYNGATPLTAFRVMEYLHQPGMRFGAGISAMPSLHVAVAFLALIACWSRLRFSALSVLAGLFFVAIGLGSIHLGWHYAVDGIVSMLGVAAIWWTSGRIVEILDKRRLAALARAMPALEQGQARLDRNVLR